MSQSYFNEEKRVEEVQRLFHTISRRYDLINDLQSFGMHRVWKRKVIQIAEIKPGDNVLDICTGTGDLAFLSAEVGAKVTALDFSPAMLDIARDRERLGSSKRRGNSPAGPSAADSLRFIPIEFIQADAMQVPFPDQHFNAVTMGYGLRNLASWKKGLAEIHRVLRPGGRVAILDLGKPDNCLWRNLYFTHLRLTVPIIGKIFGGDFAAYAYLLESLRKYEAQHGVDAALKSLGFVDVQIHSFLGGVMAINKALKPN